MNFKKLRGKLWELTVPGKVFVGTSKKDCLDQYSSWWKSRAFDYSTGFPLE